MRLAVISDVHGNLPALRCVIDHLRTQGADAIVNLGDCVSAPLWPRETYEALGELGALTVRGNHDRWLDDAERIVSSPTVAFTASELSAEARRGLATLPASRIIDGTIVAVHGTPSSDTAYLLEDAVDERLCLATAATLDERLCGVRAEVVLCGHSHLQGCAWASGRRLVLNPGSVGCPRYAGNAEPRRNEAGSPHARYAVLTRRDGRWSAAMHALDYDAEPVIARACAVGRSDWAAAFAKDR